MVKRKVKKNYRKVNNGRNNVAFDIDFNKLSFWGNRKVYNRLIKETLKKGYSIRDVSYNQNEIKKRVWYEIDVKGLNKEGQIVTIGKIKEFEKLSPKEFYNKYFLTLIEWKSNSFFVDKSGEHYAWKETVEKLSKKNEFIEGGIPLDFNVKIHFVNN